ncbi:MAG: efflux RND transporter periplasmic adaptor subunit [Pseudomonadota bacterium]
MTKSPVIAAFFFCFVGFASPMAAQDDVPRPVKVEKLSTTDRVLTRQFFGTVVARQTVDLAFQVSGQIQEFPVLEGATVTSGGLIARLDLEPFERARDQAAVQKNQADRALARLEQLSSTSVSQVTIDDAQSAADLAALALEEAEYALNNATLLAPFDGLVASRNMANFTTMSAGTPIVRLHDISEWRVEIDVPEVLFRTAGENPDLNLVGRFTGSDREIPLEVREFTAEASTVGQTFKITLAMLEEPGPGVLPGSSITVVAGLNTPSQQAIVPSSAVAIDESGQTYLMLFDSDDGESGVARRADVALETDNDGNFVLRDSLGDDVTLIVAGAKSLTDGQAVRRFTGFSN